MAGKTESITNYVHALRSRLTDRAAFVDAMDGMAALITPTVPIQAPIISQIDQLRAPSQFTRMVSHLGFCALSTPMGMTEAGLPGGLQIIGRSNEETMVLRIGAAFANDLGNIGCPADWD